MKNLWYLILANEQAHICTCIDKLTKIKIFGGFKLEIFCIWKANWEIKHKLSLYQEKLCPIVTVSFKLTHKEFKQPTSNIFNK